MKSTILQINLGLKQLSRIKAIAFGFPVLRGIFAYIQHHFIGQKETGKLLLTEDVPLNALFWELALNMLLFPTTSLHAGLNSNARQNLRDESNAINPTNPRVMITSYHITAFGTNTQKHYSRVLVVTPAVNQGVENQVSARPIRVSAAEKGILPAPIDLY